MLSLTRSSFSLTQNVKCAHPEKEISHLLANSEIPDHHKVLPDSSYLDTLHILFPASIFLASTSLWEVLSALTSLQFQPQPGPESKAEAS